MAEHNGGFLLSFICCFFIIELYLKNIFLLRNLDFFLLMAITCNLIILTTAYVFLLGRNFFSVNQDKERADFFPVNQDKEREI